MAHSRTARKRVRQSSRRRLSNRSTKTFIKTRIRKFMTAVSQGSVESASSEYTRTAQILDRAARKRIIHPNQAARKKSRLAKKLNTLRSSTSPSTEN